MHVLDAGTRVRGLGECLWLLLGRGLLEQVREVDQEGVALRGRRYLECHDGSAI